MQVLESVFDLLFHNRREDFFKNEIDYNAFKQSLCVCIHDSVDQIKHEKDTWSLGIESKRLGSVLVKKHEELTPLLRDFVRQGLQSADFSTVNDISFFIKNPSDIHHREWLTASVTKGQFKYRFRIEQDPQVINTSEGSYSLWEFLSPKKIPYDYLASGPDSEDFVGVLRSLHERVSTLEGARRV